MSAQKITEYRQALILGPGFKGPPTVSRKTSHRFRTGMAFLLCLLCVTFVLVISCAGLLTCTVVAHQMV